MSFSRAIAAGAAGTVALGVFCANLAPWIGLGQVDFPRLLAALPAGSFAPLDGVAALVLGWALLIVGGIGLALIYAFYVCDRLPGPSWFQGLAYGGLGVFLFSSFVFYPLIGLVHWLVPADQATTPGVFLAPLFRTETLLVSFLGHCSFGIIVGFLYRRRLVF